MVEISGRFENNDDNKTQSGELNDENIHRLSKADQTT